MMPSRVAELLMLRGDMPRSLLASMNEVCSTLDQIRNDQSDETSRRAGLLRAGLQYGRIDDILDTGLHPFLTAFLKRVNDLGQRISQDFLVPPAVRWRRCPVSSASFWGSSRRRSASSSRVSSGPFRRRASSTWQPRVQKSQGIQRLVEWLQTDEARAIHG